MYWVDVRCFQFVHRYNKQVNEPPELLKEEKLILCQGEQMLSFSDVHLLGG